MPYRWSNTDAPQRLEIWPHRSLSPQGFVTFIAVTSAMLTLPLFAVIGTPVLWALLPFAMGAVWMIWTALRRNARDGQIHEELTMAPAEVRLTRTDFGGQRRHWQAHPALVKIALHESEGPVPNYVILSGGDRPVELGAFLAAEERLALFQELTDRLNRLDVNAH